MKYALLMLALAACSPATIGRPFAKNPRDQVRVGFDTKPVVLGSLGTPHRRFTDPEGREVFVYVWADGSGGGDKLFVAFNSQGIAYLVENVR